MCAFIRDAAAPDGVSRAVAPASRPRLLLTSDQTASQSEAEAEYTLRANYAAALADAGGLPLILPHRPECLLAALVSADGVLITGTQPGIRATPERTAFELELIQAALSNAIPVLGICHGMQLVGQCLGGHVSESLPQGDGPKLDHNPLPIPDRPAHPVTLASDSLLNSGAQRTVSVNSLHCHALDGEGRFRVIGRAPDGVIEAIEGETPGFCLGVQWHPEYRLTDLDRDVIGCFVAASGARGRLRRA
jgi:gamma-glutamyl-gamma-aminobutyrate hydrolase PuuD